MKRRRILAILLVVLGLMVWPASVAEGAQYLTVNGADVTSITLELGQSRTVEVVSTDSTSYTAYVGFDNGVVLGDFSHLETKPEAGNLATVADYNQPTFYGYYLIAAGSAPPPSAGVHFVFQYEAQELGTTDVKLYDGALTSVTDSVQVTVIRPTMGTAFTYQGQLMDDNEPAEGLYDFQFKLYDYKSDGSQLGSTIDINDLDVIDGQFAVTLDFGSGIFDGNAVWLETTVAQGDGNDPCTLKPRVELTPTPYALYAASVAVPLELSGSSPDPIISVTNSGAGSGIYGETAGKYSTAVYGIGTGWSGQGVWGEAPGTYGIGVEGVTIGDNGYGVYGLATGSDGHGTVGRASGSSGRAVSGSATNKGDVENYGGYFVAEGEDGRGVYGEAANTGNFYKNYGGYFVARGGGGRAVCGYALNAGNVTNYGGYFEAEGEHGRGVYAKAPSRGVYGEASNTGDVINHGGYFQAAGEHGRGVYGKATNTGDPDDPVANYGGYFTAAGTEGRGVYGEASSTTSGTTHKYGGYFTAAGEEGTGVYGEASSSGGMYNYGGHFKVNNRAGRGVFGDATGDYSLGVCGYARNDYSVAVFGRAMGKQSKGIIAIGTFADFSAEGVGIDYSSSSSIRWKTNIYPIDEPLEKLILLRGVYFNWDADHGGHHDVGMIAEEVGEVMPEIVVYEENGIDANGMDYSKLTPLLVEAVKELKVENDSLKVRVEALERTMLQLAKAKELEL